MSALFMSMFPTSIEQRHSAEEKKYTKAQDAFVTYHQAHPMNLYQVPRDNFIQALKKVHYENQVPSRALVRAFEQTQGLLQGTVTPAAYNKTIQEMSSGRLSKEASFVSQVMEALSWAVFVISVACLFSGAALFGLMGIMASVAMYQIAEDPDVKDTEITDAGYDLTPIVAEMRTMKHIYDCSAAGVVRVSGQTHE